MATDDRFDRFFEAKAFGVVGASVNREKYGNKVLRCYLNKGLNAIPVNPNETEIEGVSAVAGIKDLPPEVTSISIITPPPVTEKMVQLAVEKGIRNIWMQPGAESPDAVRFCREQGVNIIADGSCILVVLGYHERH